MNYIEFNLNLSSNFLVWILILIGKNYIISGKNYVNLFNKIQLLDENIFQ